MNIECPSCHKDRWRSLAPVAEESHVEQGGVFRIIETESLECIHCSMPMTYYKSDLIIPQGVV